MNDKPKNPIKPGAVVPIKKGEKPAPGHADILGDPLDAPHRVAVTKWVDTLGDALDFARDNGLWFASQNGALSPDTLEAELATGKKLWQVFGLPPGVNPQQVAQQGDLNGLELIDPMLAVQMLRSRAEANNQAIARILDELKKPSGEA